MHLVTDPMTQDAKLVPLWRAMYVPLPPSLPFAEPFAPVAAGVLVPRFACTPKAEARFAKRLAPRADWCGWRQGAVR